MREQTTSVSFGTPVSTDTSSPSSGDRTSLMSVPLSNGSSSTTPSEQFSPQSTLKPPENATPFTPFTFENTLDSFSNDPNRSANQSSTPRVATATADVYSALAPDTEGVADSTPSGQFDYDVFWPAWPRNLPLPNMLRHLCVSSVYFPYPLFHPTSQLTKRWFPAGLRSSSDFIRMPADCSIVPASWPLFLCLRRTLNFPVPQYCTLSVLSEVCTPLRSCRQI